MSLSVTVSLELPVLESAVQVVPDADVVVEQQTAAGSDRLDLTMWVCSECPDTFENALGADDTVDRWADIGREGEWTLYRTRLTEEATECMSYHEWTDGKMVVFSAKRTTGRWVLDALVKDRSVLQSLATGCEANDVSMDLQRVADVEQLANDCQFGLTELQSETLRKAYCRGLYSVPRQINLEELAKSLDVSHQALSERLRRGVQALIENTIVDDPNGQPQPTPPEEVPPVLTATQDVAPEHPASLD